MFFQAIHIVELDGILLKWHGINKIIFFKETLFQAYFDCRRNKRNTLNALKFELHFEKYIFELANYIINGTYQPGRSIAFIVTKPVKREVFAAQFRDRIVHHWLIKKLNPYFEKAFMEDAYACRTGKGTHFGIRRMRDFMQQCAQENEGEAYVLKLDIRGFFMHISRPLLFDKLEDFISKNDKVEDKLFLLDMARRIIFNDPSKNCFIKGDKSLWDDLPKDKSIFHSPAECGLPIGNLTSQVFANFYLNDLDHFIKEKLHIKYYGRYEANRSLLFVWFLEKNKHQFKKSGELKINDNALTAIALLVAQSAPEEKKMMTQLIINLVKD